jgi:hypothetical protein
MTEQELSTEAIIRAVRQVLQEHAPGADPQDVDEFIETLREGDADELEVNLGAGFGQLCEGEAACDAAFVRYAQLVGTGEVRHNPS